MDVIFNDIRFVDDEMRSDWYDGKLQLNWLSIITDKLTLIHADAFSYFIELWYLKLFVEYGSLRILDGAFRGLDRLLAISITSETVEDYPIGLFDALATSAFHFMCYIWPNNVNFDEMFANVSYRVLHQLIVNNLEFPQTKFRALAASNFTFTRRLERLSLINCGIETIAEDTFDGMARSLEFINLSRNFITFVSFQMYRCVFESTSRFQLFQEDNGHMELCRCHVLQLGIMINPIRFKMHDVCAACITPDTFVLPACGIRVAAVDLARFCLHTQERMIMRIIAVQMTYEEDFVTIQTRFGHKLRILLLNFDAMWEGKCQARAHHANYKCFSSNASSVRLNLNEIAETHSAEFVSITVIPILYRFGTRPMHSMTVRRDIFNEHWLNDQLVVIAMMSFIFGASVVFGCAICMNSFEGIPIENEVVDARMPGKDYSYYDYTAPMKGCDKHVVPYSYDEIMERDDYVEIADTGYMAVL